MLVQAIVPELPVEALDEGVLDRLAWLDEVQLHAALVRPAVEDAARELWAVVHDDRLRQPACLRQALEHSHDPRSNKELKLTKPARPRSVAALQVKLVRGALGVIVGYAIFAATAVLLFRLSGHDPHAVQPAAFIVASVAYGMFFAALGGYVSVVVGGGNSRVQGGAVAVLIALGATVSLLAGPKAGSMWSRLAALFLMAPSALLGGLMRARSKRRKASPS